VEPRRNVKKASIQMKAVTRGLAVAALLVMPAVAADPPGFKLWKAGELRERDKALSAHVAADHSSRETLADYGDHRFRMLYRDADGNPEQHDAIIDIVYVQSGEGALALGGTMVGRRGTNPGEWVGTRLDGADRHPLARHRPFRPGFRTASSCHRGSTSPTCYSRFRRSRQ
jgi:hypothetical protein